MLLTIKIVSSAHLWFMINYLFSVDIKSNDSNLMGMTFVPQVLWFTGLSGSGKTTLGNMIADWLKRNDIPVMNLDGDVLRTGLCRDLGFTQEDRFENIRRASEVSKLFVDQGFLVVCTFISPLDEIRAMARHIIGADSFKEIFVDCPLDVCEQRDVKGLYARARQGKITKFTGISSPFEKPSRPDLTVLTETETEEESLKHIIDFLQKA